MKNFITKVVLMLVLILGTGLALFAQGVEGIELAVPQLDLFGNPFLSFGSLVISITAIVEFLKKYLTQTGGELTDREKWVIKITSWGIGIMLAFFGWYLGLGFLIGLPWYYVLMYGVGASLAANGVAGTKLIKAMFALLPKLFALFLKKK